MRLSDFWEHMERVFGASYARTLATDLVLTALGGLTVDRALESGRAPRDVWIALCDAQDVPEERRWISEAVRRRE